MSEEKSSIKFLFFKIGMYVLVICSFLFQWFGPGLIKAYKEWKEWEMISYGGSKSEYNKSVVTYNDRIGKMDILTDSVIHANKIIYIYTNDTSIKSGTLFPNINYDNFSRNDWYSPAISNNEDIIAEIDKFFEKEDSLGYVVNIETNDGGITIMKINNTQENDYIAASVYDYSETTKEHLRNGIKEGPAFSYLLKSKEQQIKELDERQFAKAIFSESELKEKKLEGSFKRLFAPSINLKDVSQVFYFTTYCKCISKEQFEVKIDMFNSMFLKGQNTSGCFIKEVYLERSGK